MGTLTTLMSVLAAIFLIKPVATFMPLAEPVPQDLKKRTTASGGGWALSQGTCPSGSAVCTSGWCCPNLLTCVHMGNVFTDNVCCPGTTQCATALQAIPVCADDSWTLWNATTVNGPTNNFFCCMSDQVGLKDGTCVSTDTSVAPSLSAISLIPSATTAPSKSTSLSLSSTTSLSVTSSQTSGTSTSSTSTSSTSSSSTPTSTSTPTAGGDNKSGLSGSTIGALVAGCVVGIALIVALILLATSARFRNMVKKWIKSQGNSKPTDSGM